MKIAYIRKHKGGFILSEDVSRCARERNIPVRSIRRDYPTNPPSREGKKATGAQLEALKKARNRRKQVRRRMAQRKPFLLWFDKIYRSRRHAHTAAAAMGCTHSSWRGKLSQCPSPEQLGIKTKSGAIDKVRVSQLVNPY